MLQNFGTFEALLKSIAEKVIEVLSALLVSKCLTKIFKGFLQATCCGSNDCSWLYFSSTCESSSIQSYSFSKVDESGALLLENAYVD